MTDDLKTDVLSVAQFRAQLDSQFKVNGILNRQLLKEWMSTCYAEARQALPEVCTPELNDQINAEIEKGWDLFEKGREYERTHGEARQASAWQPIESAPKDGTHILGWSGIDTDMRVIYWHPTWLVFIAYPQIERTWTHWMPLPLGPVLEDDAHER